MRLATYSTAALLALMFPVLTFAQNTPDTTAARSIAAANNVTGDTLSLDTDHRQARFRKRVVATCFFVRVILMTSVKNC